MGFMTNRGVLKASNSGSIRVLTSGQKRGVGKPKYFSMQPVSSSLTTVGTRTKGRVGRKSY